MARSETWTNNDGLVQGFGTRDSHNIEDAVVQTEGHLCEHEVRIDHSTVDALATDTAPTSKSIPIPTGSVIKSAQLIVLDAFADLTSIVVGTKDSDGATVDADGLIASTALADIDADGDTVEGGGDQIDGLTTDEDLYVSLDVTGTAPTAGEAILRVTYVQAGPSSDAPGIVTGEV